MPNAVADQRRPKAVRCIGLLGGNNQPLGKQGDDARHGYEQHYIHQNIRTEQILGKVGLGGRKCILWVSVNVINLASPNIALPPRVTLDDGASNSQPHEADRDKACGEIRRAIPDDLNGRATSSEESEHDEGAEEDRQVHP